MLSISVEIRRFVDDWQPGWVECAFTDAHGREWLFVEKVPVITSEDLDARSAYPCRGMIACQLVERRHWAERETVVVDTELPWGIEATTGETRFEIRPDQLIEFD